MQLEQTSSFLRHVGALVLLALVLCSCSPHKIAAQSDGLPTLRRGSGGEPESLDPAKSETNVAAHVQQDLFEGLVDIGPDNTAIPGAAESWTISPDGRTYTFTLRAGLKWSNGDPLTAEDFAYSWRRAADPMLASEYAYLADVIVNGREITEGRIKDLSQLGVDAPDPLTLRVRLVAPAAYFVSLMAHQHFYPVQRANVEKWGNQFTKPSHLVSNGAFTLKEWTPQSRLVLVKNPFFHDAERVKLGSVVYLSIESVNEEMNRFRAGQVDITFSVPVNQTGYVKKNLGPFLVISPQFASEYWGFNLTKPPFMNNPKLRQALSMVIDRDDIVRRLRYGVDVPAYGWVPPGVPGYTTQNVPWAAWPMTKRIAEAQRLYREAGYGPAHPLATQIMYNTQENLNQLAIALTAIWQDTLGVTTSITNQEFKVFLMTRHQKAATRVFRDGWYGDYLDPTSFTDLMLTGNGQNDTGYSNKQYDDLVAQGRSEVDPAKRSALLEKAERTMMADTPAIPLYYTSQLHLVASYVRGYKPSLCDYVYSKDISIDPH